METGSLVDMVRRRKAETTIIFIGYILSAVSAFGFTTIQSFLAAITGYDELAVLVGRLALLPALSALLGLGLLMRHQWRGRRFIDEAFAPPLRRTEPVAVAGMALVAVVGFWLATPGITPFNISVMMLLLALPLFWMGVRSPSPSRRVSQALAVVLASASAALLTIYAVYGPILAATGSTVQTIFAAQLGVLLMMLVAGGGLFVVGGVGYVSTERAFNRGDLEAVASMSFGGLLHDLPRVLDALRRLGRHDVLEERYLASVATVPLAGPLHVLAESFFDRQDPRTAEVAWQAVCVNPSHQGALLAYARVHRFSDPERTLDAVETYSRTLLGSDRTPVFAALEACALVGLGRASAAREVLGELELGEHPVYATEARWHADEAEKLLAQEP